MYSSILFALIFVFVVSALGTAVLILFSDFLEKEDIWVTYIQM